jgi:hypothetical protein
MWRLTLIFFLLYLAALTYPGYLPFSGVKPFVLGLPFSFVWVILWVVLGWVMLVGQYMTDRRRGED